MKIIADDGTVFEVRDGETPAETLDRALNYHDEQEVRRLEKQKIQTIIDCFNKKYGDTERLSLVSVETKTNVKLRKPIDFKLNNDENKSSLGELMKLFNEIL